MKQAISQSHALLSRIALLFAILTLSTIFVGCGPEELAGDNGQVVAGIVFEPRATPASPEQEATAAPEPVSEVVNPPQPDTCLDCHTDKDLLIDTADPVEEVVSENEGEG